MKLRFLIAGAACVFAALLVYVRSTLTYDYGVKRFEETARARIDPAALQSWATNLLTRYAASNTVDSELVSYQVKALPSDLRNVSKLYPSAFLFANPSLDKAFIRISWGSGFRGHWGLHVGATNFVDPALESRAWKPGIYFWREPAGK
jgi:hypothetical protein